MSMTKVICFANNKGGSGKSTTCSNVGYAMSAMGKKVLLIDGDMQMNLTLSFFDEEQALEYAKNGKNLYTAMREQKVDLVDEHYYRPIEWFKQSMNRYDDYPRRGPLVFAGEYACHDTGKKWNHAGASIYEAAYMTTLERNADIVHMTAYAPLFAHVEGWQWRPDLIWYDNLSLTRSCSYYVQQMYSTNKGTHVLKLLDDMQKPYTGAAGQDGLYASAVYDETDNSIVIKVINIGDESQEINFQEKEDTLQCTKEVRKLFHLAKRMNTTLEIICY